MEHMTNPPIEPFDLKYEFRFSIKKAFRIIACTSALLMGIFFLSTPDSPYLFIGIAAIMIFVRVGIGSPFETVLTNESRQHVIELYQRLRFEEEFTKRKNNDLDEITEDDML